MSILTIVIFSVLTLVIPIVFSNYLAAAALIPVAMLFIILSHDKRIWKIWIFGAIYGPLAEAICIYFGLWNYAHQDIFGLPVWLPLVWGNAFILGALSYKMLIKARK